MDQYRYTLEMDKGRFFVDIREVSLFYVKLDYATDYTMLHSSPSSLLMVANIEYYGKLVVKVCWSQYKRVAQSREHLGIELYSDMDAVSELYSKETTLVSSTYVQVMLRDYVDGSTLSSMWSD